MSLGLAYCRSTWWTEEFIAMLYIIQYKPFCGSLYPKLLTVPWMHTTLHGGPRRNWTPTLAMLMLCSTTELQNHTSPSLFHDMVCGCSMVPPDETLSQQCCLCLHSVWIDLLDRTYFLHFDIYCWSVDTRNDSVWQLNWILHDFGSCKMYISNACKHCCQIYRYFELGLAENSKKPNFQLQVKPFKNIMSRPLCPKFRWSNFKI